MFLNLILCRSSGEEPPVSEIATTFNPGMDLKAMFAKAASKPKGSFPDPIYISVIICCCWFYASMDCTVLFFSPSVHTVPCRSVLTLVPSLFSYLSVVPGSILLLSSSRVS